MRRPFVGIRWFSLLSLPLALSACSLIFPQNHVKRVAKAPKPDYQAADFVQHLSLASLSLSDSAPDMTSASADLEVLKAYTAPEPKRKKRARRKASVQQPVVVLECKAKQDGQIRKLMAPLAIEQENDALLQMVGQLDAHSCPLYNLWTATVVVKRKPPLVFNADDAQQARLTTSQLMQGMLGRAERPAPLAEAKAQMQLARIFIDGRQRDGAYLAVENAKQSLAVAEAAPETKEAVRPLLKDLESLESETHLTMPYTMRDM